MFSMREAAPSFVRGVTTSARRQSSVSARTAPSILGKSLGEFIWRVFLAFR